MGLTLNQELQLRLIAAVPQRDEAGVTISKLTLVADSNESVIVEVPYSTDYNNLLGSLVPITLQVGRVDLHIGSDDTEPYIGRHIPCPYCGTTLISTRADRLELVCFNPACDTDLIRKLYYTFSRLNISISDAELRFIITMMSTLNVLDIHLLSIIQMLRATLTADSTQMHIGIYIKLASFISQCKPSEFLILLQIPREYYEQIQVFDLNWDTVQGFFDAMQNYRSLDPGLLAYDANLMTLVYTNLHVNRNYVEEFFKCLQPVISL